MNTYNAIEDGFLIRNFIDEIGAGQLRAAHQAGLADLVPGSRAYNWTIGIISKLDQAINAFQNHQPK